MAEEVTEAAPFDSRVGTYEHIDRVRELMLQAAYNLLQRAHDHDRSKLHTPEVEVFDRVTPRLKELVYGSEEYAESLASMGPALTHHYEVNSHHPEHHELGIYGMSLLDLLEMLLDWKAASERNRDPKPLRESITMNAKRFGYSPGIERILTNTAEELGLL